VSLITSVFSLIFTLQGFLLEVKFYFVICENNIGIPQRRQGAEWKRENGYSFEFLMWNRPIRLRLGQALAMMYFYWF
jgi:hypothetical protein